MRTATHRGMASVLAGFLMAGIAVTASPAVSQEDADDVAPAISRAVPIRPRPMLPPQANKLRITVTELPVATVGERYTLGLTALGGRLPYTWTAEGLPDGLGVSGDQIVGSPDESGTFVVTLTVTDRIGVRGRTVSADVALTVLPAVFPDAEVIAVSAGGGQTCAILEGGALFCWGRNSEGQLGLGDLEDRLVPTLVANANVEDSTVPLPPMQSVTTGYNHTCALSEGGVAYCWGRNDYGQTGDDPSEPNLTPTPLVFPDGLTFTNLDAGGNHTCAISADAGGYGDTAAYCWGYNVYGQLGGGDWVGEYSSDALHVVLEMPVVAISAGGSYTCALTSNGAFWCWGSNDYGQLGIGEPTDQFNPYPAIVELGGVSAFAAGDYHGCAINGDGTSCWGGFWQDEPVLQDGSAWSPTPVLVDGLDAVAVDGGGYHTCAITTDDELVCWGGNEKGQLGIGTVDPTADPTPVEGIGAVTMVSTGGNHTCAVDTEGALWCWGYNGDGQLGDGSTDSSAVPVLVSSEP